MKRIRISKTIAFFLLEQDILKKGNIMCREYGHSLHVGPTDEELDRMGLTEVLYGKYEDECWTGVSKDDIEDLRDPMYRTFEIWV